MWCARKRRHRTVLERPRAKSGGCAVTSIGDQDDGERIGLSASLPHDDDLESLLGRRPSRRPWLELALKQGVAAAIAFALARLLPTSGGIVIVAPATAATILQSTTSGTARKAVDTIAVTVMGIMIGILMVQLLGVSILSVLLTVTMTIIICRPLPLSAESITVIALNSLFAGVVSNQLFGYRILTALIGAAVALLILLLLPQRVPPIETWDAVTAWAFRQRDLALAAADWLDAGQDVPFQADVAGVYAARRAARKRMTDLDAAVASQWIRKGPAAERSLVHQAYEALARIQPHVASAAFLVEKHSRDGDRNTDFPREKVASLLRYSAALIDARTTGQPISGIDGAAIDVTMNSLVTSAVQHIESTDDGAWDLLSLLSGITEIRRICLM